MLHQPYSIDDVLLIPHGRCRRSALRETEPCTLILNMPRRFSDAKVRQAGHGKYLFFKAAQKRMTAFHTLPLDSGSEGTKWVFHRFSFPFIAYAPFPCHLELGIVQITPPGMSNSKSILLCKTTFLQSQGLRSWLTLPRRKRTSMTSITSGLTIRKSIPQFMSVRTVSTTKVRYMVHGWTSPSSRTMTSSSASVSSYTGMKRIPN